MKKILIVLKKIIYVVLIWNSLSNKEKLFCNIEEANNAKQILKKNNNKIVLPIKNFNMINENYLFISDKNGKIAKINTDYKKIVWINEILCEKKRIITVLNMIKEKRQVSIMTNSNKIASLDEMSGKNIWKQSFPLVINNIEKYKDKLIYAKDIDRNIYIINNNGKILKTWNILRKEMLIKKNYKTIIYKKNIIAQDELGNITIVKKNGEVEKYLLEKKFFKYNREKKVFIIKKINNSIYIYIKEKYLVKFNLKLKIIEWKNFIKKCSTIKIYKKRINITLKKSYIACIKTVNGKFIFGYSTINNDKKKITIAIKKSIIMMRKTKSLKFKIKQTKINSKKL